MTTLTFQKIFFLCCFFLVSFHTQDKPASAPSFERISSHFFSSIDALDGGASFQSDAAHKATASVKLKVKKISDDDDNTVVPDAQVDFFLRFITRRRS
jgi:hypothetical protein